MTNSYLEQKLEKLAYKARKNNTTTSTRGNGLQYLSITQIYCKGGIDGVEQFTVLLISENTVQYI